MENKEITDFFFEYSVSGLALLPLYQHYVILSPSEGFCFFPPTIRNLYIWMVRSLHLTTRKPTPAGLDICHGDTLPCEQIVIHQFEQFCQEFPGLGHLITSNSFCSKSLDTLTLLTTLFISHLLAKAHNAWTKVWGMSVYFHNDYHVWFWHYFWYDQSAWVHLQPRPSFFLLSATNGIICSPAICFLNFTGPFCKTLSI